MGGRTFTRREVLARGALLGAGAALAACTGRTVPPARPTPHEPRVVVVGAGLAGLTAAYRLHRAGVPVRLFEARDRVGGRCWTARGFPDGQIAEHGGEFIDTRHVQLLGLVDELGLEVDDLWEGWVEGAIWPRWVGGEVLVAAEVREQLAPIAAAVREEARRIGALDADGTASIDAMASGTSTPGAVELDARSMADWLDEHVPGVIGSPLGAYLDASISGWYGLEMQHLSACTWIDYFVLPWPQADERWHVRGGNDQVPGRLVEALPAGTLRLETPLEGLRVRSDGVAELRFGGLASPVAADVVILALPFTTLRRVDLDGSGFGPERLAAIRTLGMGTNAKLLVPYERRPSSFTVRGRPWSGGMEHTEPSFQTWESSAAQPGRSGLITVYGGGRTAAGWGANEPHGPAPAALIQEYVGHVDGVVPGSAAAFAGDAWADLWTQDPWARGSYAAFLPGQYTRFWGATGRPEGHVHFAGEHTSTHSQGYLNGAVESGERAAAEVLRELGRPVPAGLGASP